MRLRNPFVAAIFYLVLGLLYLPLFYLIFQTFLVDPNQIHSGFTLRWISRLFHSTSLWTPLLTSLEIAVAAATLSAFIGTLGAIGLFPISSTLPPAFQTLIMLPIMLPEVITGLSLLLFFLLIRIPLGMFTIVLAHASFSASFVYFIMVEQLRKLDPQIEEAARDLGAPPDQVFWRVTLPNIFPGFIGGWLLAFTLSFDDFLISFFTSGAGVITLPLKIYSLMKIGISPEVNGLSFVMICISTLLVVLLLSKEESQKWVLG